MSGNPVVLDLCCGLGGWTRGFLAEGYDCIGFDVERHVYGDKRYPGELILADVLTLNGYELRAAQPSVIVASPPCQRYSYMAMPWKRGKAMARAIREDETGARLRELNALFNACIRIAWQCGVPIVLENVKGAQPWVGEARAHFGSYYLWGDIESVGGRIVGPCPKFGEGLRAAKRTVKREGRNFHFPEKYGIPSPSFHGADHEESVAAALALSSPTKNDGGSWFNLAHNTESGTGKNPVHELEGLKRPGRTISQGFNNWPKDESGAYIMPDGSLAGEGVKQRDSGDAWFDKALDERRKEAAGTKAGGDWFGTYADEKAAGTISPTRTTGNRSNARKAASAMIAEIPFDLAQHVARIFKPS
jgi:hypothetical protein